MPNVDDKRITAIIKEETGEQHPCPDLKRASVKSQVIFSSVKIRFLKDVKKELGYLGWRCGFTFSLYGPSDKSSGDGNDYGNYDDGDGYGCIVSLGCLVRL